MPCCLFCSQDPPEGLSEPQAQRDGLSANLLSPVAFRKRPVFVPGVLVVLNVSFAPMYSQISQLDSMSLSKQHTFPDTSPSFPLFLMQTEACFCLASNHFVPARTMCKWVSKITRPVQLINVVLMVSGLSISAFGFADASRQRNQLI